MPCLLRFFLHCPIAHRNCPPKFCATTICNGYNLQDKRNEHFNRTEKISERKRHENNRQTNLYICITDVSHS